MKVVCTFLLGAAMTVGWSAARAENALEKAAREATAQFKLAEICDDCGVVRDVRKLDRSEQGGVTGILGKIGVGDDEVWQTRVTLKNGDVERFEHDKKPDFNAGDVVVVDGRRLRKR